MAAVQSYGGSDPHNTNPQFPTQGGPGQMQQGYPQENPNEQYLQQPPYGQNGGAYNGQQQQMGQQQPIGQQQHMGGQQQMGTNNYAQGGGGQQMNSGAGEQAPVVDNRDTITKWLDKIEKKFGGERFNNPANAEKNQKMNANILKRLKQVGALVVKKAPGMLMKMAR